MTITRLPSDYAINIDASNYLFGQRNNYNEEEDDEDQEARPTKSIRFALVLFIITLIILSTTNLRSRLVPIQVPEAQIKSLTVSNFKATNESVFGDWNVSYTITNVDSNITFSLTKIYTTLYFEDQRLADNSMETNSLKFEPGKNRVLNTGIEMNTSAKTDLDVTFKNIIALNKDKGMLVFNMAFYLSTRVVASWWGKEVTFYYGCDDIEVQFASKTAGATSNVGGDKFCRGTLAL